MELPEAALQALRSGFKACLFLGCITFLGLTAKQAVPPSDLVAPYLIPADHPAKGILDRIFSASRATINIKSLKKAGFIKPKVLKWTHIVVTRHPDLPGYVFKIYLDAQRNFKNETDYEHWIARIQGAQAVQQLITKNGWEGLVKVPQKWIYRLPKKPAPPSDLNHKNFILIETDMQLLTAKDNEKAWKSTWVTKEKLNAVYTILKEVGLHDCAKPHNIPFSKDRRIAFIDTETWGDPAVPFDNLTHSLPEDLQSYWTRLASQ